MPSPLLKTLTLEDVQFRRDIWHLRGTEINFSNLLDSVSRLQTQLEVQNVLLSTEQQLRSHPDDKTLPNQQAMRVKHFVKFVFEANPRAITRQTQLRNLDCSSLKLCGLSYTVREITELSLPVFNFLVDNVADFVKCKDLSLLLCRDDINKAVLSDFDPEDEERFKKFLTSHIELRLAQRKGRQSSEYASSSCNRDLSQVPAASPQQNQDDSTNPRKRARKDEENSESHNSHSGRQIRHMYSKAPTDRISLLGDLVSDAIRTSHQWKIERELGEPTTDCVTTLIPHDTSLDISITLWVGQEAGLRMNDTLDLLPKWTSLPNRVEP